MSQQERMYSEPLYAAPPRRDVSSTAQYQALPPRQSSTVPLHVTSPSGITSQEYEYKPAPPLSSYNFPPSTPPVVGKSPQSAREIAPRAAGPIARVCPKCGHNGPPISVRDTSKAAGFALCCEAVCGCLSLLLGVDDDDTADSGPSDVAGCAKCKEPF